MEQFEAFMARHGEHGMQAIVENWERHQGIRHIVPMTLERRWINFMRDTAPQPMRIAA